MIFFDVETQNFFTDAAEGENYNYADLKVSFVGVYNADTDEYLSFWEKDMPKLEKLLKSADKVVGYNSWAFDNGVIAPYFKTDPHTFPSMDLMIAMKKTVGFRPKLDNLARANDLGSKLAAGSDAVEYWNSGELDKLEKYCLEDVRLTYEVWRVGEENRTLKYYDQSGFIRETPINWQDGFMQKLDETVQGTLL